MSRDTLYGYSVNLIRLSDEDGGGWLAEVPELRGCLTDGDYPEEALENLKDVIETWLEVADEEGKERPYPRIYSHSEYSGKFTLRIPKTLHGQLAQEADKEGVSLNQFVLSLIAYNYGAKHWEGTKTNEAANQRKGARLTYEVWSDKFFEEDIQNGMVWENMTWQQRGLQLGMKRIK